jgi:chromosomal replication initiation ATPase DnaA
MNQFVKYLSEKYGFNIEQEWGIHIESNPAFNKEQLFKSILDEVCKNLNISRSEILGLSRKRDTMYARHLLTYIMYRTRLFPLTEIGRMIGGRNHATIIHSRDVAEDLISVKDGIMYPLYLKVKHLINENNTSSSTM